MRFVSSLGICPILTPVTLCAQSPFLRTLRYTNTTFCHIVFILNMFSTAPSNPEHQGRRRPMPQQSTQQSYLSSLSGAPFPYLISLAAGLLIYLVLRFARVPLIFLMILIHRSFIFLRRVLRNFPIISVTGRLEIIILFLYP